MSDPSVTPVVVGVDVGGTNTDAVAISKSEGGQIVLAGVKELTTSDVTTGVSKAVQRLLLDVHASGKVFSVVQVNIGTTHFVNATVQGKDLAKVTVLRLCGSTSHALPPFSDFPRHLKDVICCKTHLLSGGYRFDGKPIDDINREEIEDIVRNSEDVGFVVSGIFSPIRSNHEEEVEQIIKATRPDASVTLSNRIGHLGLLERENAAILNECLKPLCSRTITGFTTALDGIGLKCPIFLTQNDGTIISADNAKRFPVHTFASGPTNSMRGAAFLSEVKDAIVVDIGGTTTDVGVLKKGFPREASSQVKIGGVRTNFRMPDVLSIGLGGGSYVVTKADEKGDVQSVRVGPLSAGYNLKKEAIVFSEKDADPERQLTATDIAVAAAFTTLGNPDRIKTLSPRTVKLAVDKIHQMIEESIDKVKLSDESLPVILVGGGSILIDVKREIKGASKVILPEHFGIANAIGAALSQVSGSIDVVVSILDQIDTAAMDKAVQEAIAEVVDDPTGREAELAEEIAKKPFILVARDKALKQTTEDAIDMAVRAGALRSSVEVSERQDMTIAYMPGQATRIKVKVVGNLAGTDYKTCEMTAWSPTGTEIHADEVKHSKQSVTATGATLSEDEQDDDSVRRPVEPIIDPSTGEWILSAWDIECIVLGSGIYGCGGGGSPHMGRLRALKAVRSGKQIRVVTPEKLLNNAHPENDLVGIVCFYGAPLIMYEQLVSSKETTMALRCMEDLYNIGQYKNGNLENKKGVEIKEKAGMRFVDDYQQTTDHGSDIPHIKGKNIKALMSIEIGGMNAIEPLLVASNLNLPIVDADAMGRAFPKVSMTCPLMYGLPPYPASLVDDKNRRAVMLESPSATLLEHHFRDVVTTMGCSAGFSFSPLVKEDVMTKTVLHTVSKAWALGNAILRARINKTSPIEAILNTDASFHVMMGKVRDVQRETSGGYNKGRVMIEGLDTYSGQKILINFQNENLVIIPMGENDEHGEIIACVPDLISIVDADTAEPVPTEEVRYGMRVSVIVIASPDILRTETALKFVGPQAFQYPETVKFKPYSACKPIKTIPPTK